MGRRTALALLTLVSAISCAGLLIPKSGLVGWHEVEIGPLRILAQAPPVAIEALARELAGVDAAFANVIGSRPEAVRSRTVVLIQHPRLARRLGLTGSMVSWPLRTPEGDFACASLGPSPTWTRFALMHEYTHLLLARQYPTRLPGWYDEGVALYFMTVEMRDGALVVGSVPAMALLALATRGSIPLDQLLAETPRPYRATGPDFHASAWALTHYLLASPAGRGELARLAGELTRGAPLEVATKAAFDRPLEELAAVLDQHVSDLRSGDSGEFVLGPHQVAIHDPPAPRSMLRAEVAEELGSLALAWAGESGERRPATVAAALLQIAVDEDPSSARALAGLGQAKASLGDLESAERMIGAALRDAPNDSLVQLRAGRVALAAGDSGRAESHFRNAVAGQDTSAAAWFGLARAQLDAGRREAALEAFQRARSIARSDRLDLEIGRLHLSAGRRDEAYALLWTIAQDPHGGRMAEEAAALLGEAGLMPDPAPGS